MNTSEPDTAPDTNTTTDADTDGHAEATCEELWAYAGLRLHGTKRRHAWVTDSGTGQEKRFAVRKLRRRGGLPRDRRTPRRHALPRR